MFLGGKPPKRLLLEVAEGKYMLLLKTGFYGIPGTPSTLPCTGYWVPEPDQELGVIIYV